MNATKTNVEHTDEIGYRVLNTAGQLAVSEWVKTHALLEQDMDAWYSVAEDVANNAAPGESIVIEMRGMHTISSRPETLKIPADFMR